LFLASLLIAGTIVAIFQSSSFMTEVHAALSADYEKMMMMDDDNNNYKSKDPTLYKKNDDINCNNFNLNANGLNVNEIPESLRNLIAPESIEESQTELEDSSIDSSTYGNDEKRFGSYFDKKDFVYKCINNNDNKQILLSNLSTPQTPLTTNNVYIVWQDDNLGNFEIFFAVSRDGGQTFSNPKNLSKNLGASVDPQIVSQGDNVYVVWKDNTPDNNDIFFAVSRDGGLTFSSPKNISETPEISERPQISVEEKNVYVVWQDNTPSILDIFFAVSDNGGQTFSSRNLSHDAGESENAQISSEGNDVYVVWRNTTSEDSDIFFTVSDNNGLNFITPKNLSNTGSANAPQLSSEENSVYIVWQDVAFGNNDIFIAVSDNNGLNFITPQNLSKNAGFSENPQIVSEGNNVYVVWQDNTGNADIFLVVSNNNGQTFSTTAKNISDNVEVSTAPQISTEGNNVNVVWQDFINGNDHSDIFFAVSNNNGETFSTPENIIDNAEDSFAPQISSEENNVYVVWRNDSIGGFDIFFAVSTNNGHTFSRADNLSNNTGTSENPQISSSVS
jgi:hypothetical protein